MRRRRNKLEYPQSREDIGVELEAAQKAIAYVQSTIEAVTQLLPQLDLWR